MEAKKLVGWNIRRLRVERGLTIEELAAEADVASAYLGQLERGTVNVGVTILGRVAKVLGTRIGELFVEPVTWGKASRATQSWQTSGEAQSPTIGVPSAEPARH
jgi:transcriptional regulator with XRE-family HTH domain